MGDKSKKICKWEKDSYRKDAKKLREIVQSPRFYCRDCGRVANEKDYVCKPEKL